MPLVDDTVVELDLAAGNLNVIEGKRRNRPRILHFRLSRQFVDEIGKVETVRIQTRYADSRIDEPDFIDHRPPAEQRGRLQIDEEAVEPDERFNPLPLLDFETFQCERQGIRVDADALDRHGPMQQFAYLAERDMFDDRRQHEEAKHSDQNNRHEQTQAMFPHSW